MPILGTLASQFSGKPFTLFESISTVTVGSGGASNIEFTSIPNTYTHLQIRGIFKTNRADDNDRAKIQFNSDTSNNYSNHSFLGTGSSVTAAGNANTSSILTFVGAGNNVSSVFGAGIIDILEYKNTNIYKTIRSLGGYESNSTGINGLDSGSWRSTSAITSIKLTPNIGSNFNQYSQFALYGIKES